jgi:SAM-dependent methyltransferase
MRFLRKVHPMTSVPSKPGITRDDVVSAYRFILGREPESESVVQSAVEGYESREELRLSFLQSAEFNAAMGSPEIVNRFPHDHHEGGQPIEVNCDRQVLGKLLAHIEKTWNRLGEQDPYWSVLSRERFSGDNFQNNQEAFWNSGKGDVVRLQRWLQRNEITLAADATCLEYGCGTGRITRWLSRQFQTVVACDISKAHLQLAQQELLREPAGQVTFLHIDHLSRLEELPAFDVLFSIIVLQHNPPPVIAYVLDKLLARLRPGGVAYFQLPTFRPDYRFVVSDYLDAVKHEKRAIEMHVLPQRYVFQIAARNDCELIEVAPDNMVGLWEFVSNTFLLRKRVG